TNLGVRNLVYFRDMLNEIGQVNIEVSEDTCVWSLGPKGGLNSGSLKSFNIALLQKWRWRCSLPQMIFGLRSLKLFRVMKVALTIMAVVSRVVELVYVFGKIFRSRLSLDRLPHRLNLALRGMDISAISCSSCNTNVESSNHIFFECIIATEMWKLVYIWCEIPFAQASSLEAFKDWFISWHASKEKKHRLYVISTSRQIDLILDGLAEVPSIDRVPGQWLNVAF
nr:RNA-directed DNA polymerase, eukaryota [Tanacetum cinerariifolium]